MTNYFYNLYRDGDIEAEVRINGIPAMRAPASVEFFSSGYSANHMLEAGQNTISLLVTGDSPKSGRARLAFGILPEGGPEVQRIVLHELKFPEDAVVDETRTDRSFSLQGRRFTISQIHEVEASLPDPVFARLPPEDVPAEGNDELYRPIAALQDAFVAGDHAKVTELLSFKADTLSRCYGQTSIGPAALAERSRRMVPGPYEMTPLAREDLVFEPGAGARVVHVRRRDGTKAVRGHLAGQAEPVYETDLVLVRQSDGFRIFV